MKRDATPSHFAPSSCRFMFGNAAGDGVLREFLAADMQAARLSAKFRAYYRVRSLLPISIRQMLQRYRRVESRSGWYFPNECIAALSKCLAEGAGGIYTIHPWPNGAHIACVLTHDVETEEGLRRILQITRLEEEFGLRSAWNVVPYKYPVDRGLLRELASRGFEIGVHGFNHDGKLFSTKAVFEGRVAGINAALHEFGAVGFRAPMVHRNLGWLQALNIDYDASCFDVDPYQPMPGGVGGVWPFVAGRFVELPYTLPQDHTLFVALGERNGQIWSDKLAYLTKLRGMALLNTHPDYLDTPERLDIYRRFLAELCAVDRPWHALPRDVAAWWRDRDASSVSRESDDGWCVRGAAESRGQVVQVDVAPNAGEMDWSFTAQRMSRQSILASTVDWEPLTTAAASLDEPTGNQATLS